MADFTERRRVEETSPSATAGRLSRNVLVIDDEPEVREITSEMVERAGLASLVAADGRAGLDLVRDPACEVGLVLLDMTMPGFGGAETLAEIRRTHPDLPVILVSGYSEEISASRCTGSISGFLKKPFSREELADALQLALASESEPTPRPFPRERSRS